jgi:hypothetical protein
MARLPYVLLHVLVLGSITAAHITTDRAHPQIRPTIPRVDTILADIRAWFTDLDQMQVGAGFFFELAGESQFKEELRYAEARRFGHLLFSFDQQLW